MDIRNNHLRLAVAGALLGAMLSRTVFSDNLTSDNGAPVGDNQNSQAADPGGSALLQDLQLIRKPQRLDRECSSERVIHARDTAAHGEFVAAADMSAYRRANVFMPGTATPVVAQFSTVVYGNCSPEALGDPHGFATKFCIMEGNWGLIGNNLPGSFNRDPAKCPHLYSNFGMPASYQMIPGNGVQAYRFVNAGDEITYVQFHWKTPHAGNEATRCEWHSSVSSKTLVGVRFSVRVPTFIPGTPSQAQVASSGSNSREFSCSG